MSFVYGNLSIPAGSSSNPALRFGQDTNTGIYNSAADTLDFTTGGSNRLSISTTNVTSTIPFLGSDGSASAPSLSFSADTNTGFYRSGADTLNITTAGTNRLSIDSTGTVSVIATNGSIYMADVYGTNAPAIGSVNPISTTNFAFLQTTIGNTNVNAPTGKNVFIRNNDSIVMTVTTGKVSVTGTTSNLEIAPLFSNAPALGSVNPISTSNYALFQETAGNTFINAPTGTTVNIRNNNTTIMSLGTTLTAVTLQAAAAATSLTYSGGTIKTVTSDQRIKKNINDYSVENAWNIIDNLKVRTYNFKSKEEIIAENNKEDPYLNKIINGKIEFTGDTSKNYVGFIAQELIPVSEELAPGSHENGYSISLESMIPYLVKTIQDLKHTCKELRQSYEELKNQLE